MKKIIIFNRFKYFGGTLVLSCLCKTLRELGYDAKLYMCTDIPFSDADVQSFKRQNFKRVIKYKIKHVLIKYFSFIPYIKKLQNSIDDVSSVDMDGLSFHKNPSIDINNSIVIYPEVTYGNPLNAKFVVRWLMYFYPYSKSSDAYSTNDLFIAYREYFNDIDLNPNKSIITLNYFDSKLYRQYNFGQRKNKCYILRKGRKRKDLPKHFDGPVFDDNMSQHELVKMFNEYRYCYSYDTQTFYTAIAAVCGCIPIVVMEPGKCESDYLGPGEKHLGRAYGDSVEQIEYAKKTRDDLIKKLDYSAWNRVNAQALIELLEDKFGKIKRI